MPNPAFPAIRNMTVANAHTAAAVASLTGDAKNPANPTFKRARGSRSQINRPTKAMATNDANSGQRVSRMSSLRMSWTALNAISGRNKPAAISAVKAAARKARARSGREAGASSAISHLLHFRPAEQALRQEDHHD